MRSMTLAVGIGAALLLRLSPGVLAEERVRALPMGIRPVLHLSFDGGKEQLPVSTKVVGATFVEEGKVNGAYSFNGKDNYILLEGPEGLPEKRAPRSISVWFKLRTYDRRAVIGGYGTPRTGENFQIESGAGRQFWIMGWGKRRDWGTGIKNKRYFDDQWHHIVLSYDSKRTKVYVDGIMKASTAKFHWDTKPTRIVLGEEIDLAGRAFDGLLDEFMIFDSALSVREVRSLHDWAK